MKVKFSGHIRYANGAPVSNVIVRIFDKDAPDRQDDDLTLKPGLSDEKGRFSITYEPLRYLNYQTTQTQPVPTEPFNTPAPWGGIRLPDFGDLYLPYLQFNYTFNGLLRHHTASLGIFKSEFYLPENPPVEFRPSVHGFRFLNQFSGYFLPFSTPAFMGAKKVTSRYGLCGGMCSAAYDFALATRTIPTSGKPPRQGTRFQRYLFRRQMDSLGGMGQEVLKVAQWSSMPDDTLVGVQAHTLAEFEQVRRKLDDKNPCLLALIYARATSIKELSRLIFTNHQVLAYAYQDEPASGISIQVYDPNLPGRDDVLLRCEQVTLGEITGPAGIDKLHGFKTIQLVGGEFYRDVRGFFRMPYTSEKPPRGI